MSAALDRLSKLERAAREQCSYDEPTFQALANALPALLAVARAAEELVACENQGLGFVVASNRFYALSAALAALDAP